jgi:hypothetical protein
MSSKNIYTLDFIPTYLYIKQHSITKLKYFGKTTKKDPVKYLGSGKYWKRHIKKHGTQFVETIWYQLFADKESLVEYALKFSSNNNIVESKEWVNLKLENGLDGALNGDLHHMWGKVHSAITRNKMSVSRINFGLNNKYSTKFKQAISDRNTNTVMVYDTRLNKNIRVNKNIDNYDELISNNILIFIGKLRTQESKNKTKDKLSNRFHCYNKITNERKFLKLDEDMPIGFILGVSDEFKETVGKRMLNLIYYHNPLTNEQIRIYAHEDIPDNYIKGRLNFGANENPFKGKCKIYNILEEFKTGRWINIKNISKFEVSNSAKYLLCINSPTGLKMSYSDKILKQYLGTGGIVQLCDNKVIRNRTKNIWLKNNFLGKNVADIGFKYYELSKINPSIVHNLIIEGYEWVL